MHMPKRTKALFLNSGWTSESQFNEDSSAPAEPESSAGDGDFRSDLKGFWRNESHFLQSPIRSVLECLAENPRKRLANVC